jgi:hypothetical protein
MRDDLLVDRQRAGDDKSPPSAVVVDGWVGCGVALASTAGPGGAGVGRTLVARGAREGGRGRGHQTTGDTLPNPPRQLARRIRRSSVCFLLRLLTNSPYSQPAHTRIQRLHQAQQPPPPLLPPQPVAGPSCCDRAGLLLGTVVDFTSASSRSTTTPLAASPSRVCLPPTPPHPLPQQPARGPFAGISIPDELTQAAQQTTKPRKTTQPPSTHPSNPNQPNQPPTNNQPTNQRAS